MAEPRLAQEEEDGGPHLSCYRRYPAMPTTRTHGPGPWADGAMTALAGGLGGLSGRPGTHHVPHLGLSPGRCQGRDAGAAQEGRDIPQLWWHMATGKQEKRASIPPPQHAIRMLLSGLA